jgi:hypothetical protein
VVGGIAEAEFAHALDDSVDLPPSALIGCVAITIRMSRDGYSGTQADRGDFRLTG